MNPVDKHLFDKFCITQRCTDRIADMEGHTESVSPDSEKCHQDAASNDQALSDSEIRITYDKTHSTETIQYVGISQLSIANETQSNEYEMLDPLNVPSVAQDMEECETTQFFRLNESQEDVKNVCSSVNSSLQVSDELRRTMGSKLDETKPDLNLLQLDAVTAVNFDINNVKIEQSELLYEIGTVVLKELMTSVKEESDNSQFQLHDRNESFTNSNICEEIKSFISESNQDSYENSNDSQHTSSNSTMKFERVILSQLSIHDENEIYKQSDPLEISTQISSQSINSSHGDEISSIEKRYLQTNELIFSKSDKDHTETDLVINKEKINTSSTSSNDSTLNSISDEGITNTIECDNPSISFIEVHEHANCQESGTDQQAMDKQNFTSEGPKINQSAESEKILNTAETMDIDVIDNEICSTTANDNDNKIEKHVIAELHKNKLNDEDLDEDMCYSEDDGSECISDINEDRNEPWWIRKSADQTLDPEFLEFINTEPHYRVPEIQSNAKSIKSLYKFSPMYLLIGDITNIQVSTHNPSKTAEKWYKLFDQIFYTIMFHGRIVEKKRANSYVLYTVDDGTGSVKVRFNHSSQTIKSNLHKVNNLESDLCKAKVCGLPNMLQDSQKGLKADEYIAKMERLILLIRRRLNRPARELQSGNRVHVIGHPYFNQRSKTWSVSAFTLELDESNGSAELFWKSFMLSLYKEIYYK